MNYNIAVVLVLIALSLHAQPALAHTDPQPMVEITPSARQVDTDVVIRIFAKDDGYKAGIDYISLLEDGKEIQRKFCMLASQCQAEYTIHHNIKGTHTYSAIAADRSQNKKLSSTSVRFLGFDQPPLLSFEENPYAEEGYSLNLLIFTADRNKYPVTVTASRLPRGATFDGTYFRWTPDYGQAGNYVVTFTAKNSMNLSTSRAMKINVKEVERAPEIVSVSPQGQNIEIYEGNSITFNVNAADPDGNVVIEWMLDNKRVSTGRSYTYRPDYDDAGTHLLVVRAYDKEYTRRNAWIINVKNVNREPSMNRIGSVVAEEGDTIRFTITARDPDNDPLVYSASNLPKGARFDPDKRTFEWKTASRDKGFYDVTFTVRDQGGFSASQKVEIEVRGDDSDIDYHELYHQREELMNRLRQQQLHDRGQLVVETPLMRYLSYYKAIMNTTAECRPGYLCSSVYLISK